LKFASLELGLLHQFIVLNDILKIGFEPIQTKVTDE